MKAITAKSGSGKKISVSIQPAKKKSVETVEIPQLTDEEMAAPGEKVTTEQLEAWLAKEDGEKLGIDEAFSAIRREYVNVRKKKQQ